MTADAEEVKNVPLQLRLTGANGFRDPTPGCGAKLGGKNGFSRAAAISGETPSAIREERGW
jgi:hypothetical protein